MVRSVCNEFHNVTPYIEMHIDFTFKVIQEDEKLYHMSTFLRQKIINWCGHIMRSGKYKLSRKMMVMVVPCKRRGGLDRDGLTTAGKI